MNRHWQNFLQQNEQLSQNCADDFVALLSDYGLFEVTGEDAQSFLQNQLSNDINLVTDGNFQLSGYCTPKGRLLALFMVVKSAQGYYLIAPKAVLETSVSRLKKYVMMSKVEFLDLCHWQHLGWVGPKSTAYMVQNDIRLEPWQQARLGELQVLRMSGPTNRYLCFAPSNVLEAKLSSDNPDLYLASQNCWLMQQILSGEAQVYPNTVELFIPQMLNLQVMNGLSFTKGCYPGQEIVARTQYRGTLKRRMYLAHTKCEQHVEPGQELWVHDNKFDKDEVAGNVVVASKNNDEWHLLVVLQNKYLQEPIHCHNSQGAILKIASLPYSLDSEN